MLIIWPFGLSELYRPAIRFEWRSMVSGKEGSGTISVAEPVSIHTICTLHGKEAHVQTKSYLIVQRSQDILYFSFP